MIQKNAVIAVLTNGFNRFNISIKYSKLTLLLFIIIAILVSPDFLKLKVNANVTSLMKSDPS